MEPKRNEIITALECCRGKGCKECPYNCNCATCISTLQGDALSLIKELTEENGRLKARVLEENHLRHQAEEMLANGMSVVKADTVSKMHSEIEARCIKGGIYPAFVASTIDQIAKEMLEGEK
jgi:hypothetical protein